MLLKRARELRISARHEMPGIESDGVFEPRDGLDQDTSPPGLST
jgi:hypothetical protein